MARPASSGREPSATRASLGQALILTLWLGAALFFAAAVAPAAFDVLPSRDLAGALVGRTLPVVFISGALGALLVLALEMASVPRQRRVGRRAAAGVAIAACLIAQLVVAPQIASLRASLSAPLASLATDDPQRVAFGRLHMISVAWLGVAMLAATTGIALATLDIRSGGAR